MYICTTTCACLLGLLTKMQMIRLLDMLWNECYCFPRFGSPKGLAKSNGCEPISTNELLLVIMLLAKSESEVYALRDCDYLWAVDLLTRRLRPQQESGDFLFSSDH